MRSPAELAAQASPDERAAMIARLGPKPAAAAALRSWKWWARPEQRGPDFRTPENLPAYAADLALTAEQIAEVMIWLVLTGRGWGKTRTGAEWICDRAEHPSRAFKRGALIGTTAAHTRDVMVEGESGLGAVAERRGIHLKYEPSKRSVTLRPGGTRHSMKLTTFSAESPDLLAGPQHDTAWGDEPGSWSLATDGAGRTAWDNCVLGLRLGPHPMACLTGTPRATPLIKGLLAPTRQTNAGGDVLTTVGTIFDNPYLPPSFLRWVTDRYAGSRLGQQELLGLLIEALGRYFRRAWWDEPRADGRTRWWEPAAWAEHLQTMGVIRVRYWDLASTEADGDNDPDWTAGSLVALTADGQTVWEDCRMTRSTPGGVEQLVARTAQNDPPGTIVYVEQDPGQAGKSQLAHYRDRVLGPLGVVCRPWSPSGPKETRATLPSTLAESGRLWIVRQPRRPDDLAEWWATALDQLEEFPDAAHDDIVDSLSGACAVLHQQGTQAIASSSAAAAEARLPTAVARPR